MEPLRGKSAEESAFQPLPGWAPVNERARLKKRKWGRSSRAMKDKKYKSLSCEKRGGISRGRHQQYIEKKRSATPWLPLYQLMYSVYMYIYAWGLPHHLQCQFCIRLIFDWQLTSTPIKLRILLVRSCPSYWVWRVKTEVEKVNLFFRQLLTVIAPASVCPRGKVTNYNWAWIVVTGKKAFFLF